GATQVAEVPAPAPRSPPSGACQEGASTPPFGRARETVAECTSPFTAGQTLATSDCAEASATATPPRRKACTSCSLKETLNEFSINRRLRSLPPRAKDTAAASSFHCKGEAPSPWSRFFATSLTVIPGLMSSTFGSRTAASPA